MTGESANGKAIKKVSYSHDAVIDMIIAHPQFTQGQLAGQLGYTQPWLSRVIRSDAFKERLAERKGELVDPLILQEVEQRFECLLEQSLEIIQQQLALNPSFDKALKAADLGARAMGYGAKNSSLVVNNTPTFVVAMPAKAADSEEWLKGRVVEAAPGTP